MKRIITLAIAVTVIATPSTALAQPLSVNTKLPDLFKLNVYGTDTQSPLLPSSEVAVETPKETPPEKPKPVKKPKHIVYTVVEGDNLTKIGTDHKVKWQRLWAKNRQLKHPDRINIGDKITIPFATEKLKRKIPAAVNLPVVTPGVPVSTQAAPSASLSYDGSNTYTAGYCTWYVKNRRGASLPNGLGNANTWYSNAQSMGMATGTEPRKGAVGTTTGGALGHVVYVEDVYKNGTILISEMNYAGLYSQRTRTANANEFLYIY